MVFIFFFDRSIAKPEKIYMKNTLAVAAVVPAAAGAPAAADVAAACAASASAALAAFPPPSLCIHNCWESFCCDHPTPFIFCPLKGSYFLTIFYFFEVLRLIGRKSI